MPRVPQQKRSEQTRARILEAGKRLFMRDGYHSTSRKKIAAEAGVAIGSFYSYFDDQVVSGQSYDYALEVMYLGGHRALEGPAQVAVRWRLKLPLLQ